MKAMGEREIRLGFIGTGGIAGSHMRQLKELGNVAFVAHCDVAPERAQKAAKEYGGEAYTEHKKLLERKDLDAVYVCVPPHVHGDMELDTVKRGVPMFVEKPVNLYMDKAREVAAAVEKAGLLTCVGYSLRYMAGAYQAEKLLAGRRNEIGQVLSVRWGGLPGTPWWRRMEMSGGQLVEQTTHQVDILRAVLGEVVHVQASYAYRLMDEESCNVPDSQCVLLTFACGALGIVTCTCAMKAGGTGTIEFMLRGGRLIWGAKGCTANPPEAFQIPEVPADFPKNIDDAFVRALRTGDASGIKGTSYAEGVKTLAITLAANVSAAEGRAVRPDQI